MKLMTRKSIERKILLKIIFRKCELPYKKYVNDYLQSHPVLVMVNIELKTMK